MLAQLRQTVVVSARGARCNVNPHLNQIVAAPIGMSGEAFANAFATDAAFRSLFGEAAFVGYHDLTYFDDIVVLAFPPLEDQLRALDRFRRSGALKGVFLNGNLSGLSPPDTLANVVEYYNSALDHYFMTGDVPEQRVIEGGGVGPGWKRTGKQFMVVERPGFGHSGEEGGFHPVYRFTGIPNVGPSSHFFTVSPVECAVVRDRREWGWTFEGAPFYANEPKAGGCPTGLRPLYRAYNNGKGGSPNHRFAIERATIEAMVAQGWVDEGVAMCVLP